MYPANYENSNKIWREKHDMCDGECTEIQTLLCGYIKQYGKPTLTSKIERLYW